MNRGTFYSLTTFSTFFLGNPEFEILYTSLKILCVIKSVENLNKVEQP